MFLERYISALLYAPNKPSCNNSQIDLLESNLLFLSHPVYTTNSLLFSTDVEQRLNKQHVCGLDDVQTLGTGMERKQKNVHIFAHLELGQVGLKSLVVRD